MSIVSEIRTHLNDGQTVFKTVAGAIEFSQIEKKRLASPAAYVMVPEDASGENSRMAGVLQRLETDVAVLIVVDNFSGLTGEAAGDELEDLKAFVRTKLIGFEPASAGEPITHVSGELLKASGGTVWWEDRFSVPSYLEHST